MHKLISARFDGGEKEHMARDIEKRLKDLGVKTFIVAAGAGDDFGMMTAIGLKKMDTMIAICYDNYGQKTESAYCSYYEVKYCVDHQIPVIPVRLSEDWPPKPPGPEEAGAFLDLLFPPSRVFIDGRNKSATKIAGEIASRLAS